MKRFKLLLFVLTLLFQTVMVQAQNESSAQGEIMALGGQPLSGASVRVVGQNITTQTDVNGKFSITLPSPGTYTVVISNVGYKTKKVTLHTGEHAGSFTLQPYDTVLSTVEVFGHTRKQPDKLDAITGMPLGANEQIQSVSTISSRLIQEQDNQDISDALRNVTGVILFSNFGGIGNSYTIRGIRGITTLMNGIQLDNDFRGHGIMPDMATIDNIQVLKGSYAISQGLSNSLGAVGGIVNAVTKTPNFMNAGNVSLRYGSWNNVRATYDVERLLNKRFSVRLAGAVEAGDGYREHTTNQRFAINPSFAWKPDDKTRIIGEFHFQHDSRTPDRGTVNLAADSVNGLWDIPNNKFLGFTSDHNTTDAQFWGLRLIRSLTDKLDLKLSYYGSRFKQDFNSAVAGLDADAFKATGVGNVRYRYMNHVTENDKSSVVSIALVGHDLDTWGIHHTFQTGVDYRHNEWFSQAFNSNNIDTIDVYKPFTNTLSNQNLTYTENKGRYYNRYYSTYGAYGQDMITVNRYVKGLLGLRYSHTESVDRKTNTYTAGHGVDPIFGVFLSPLENIHFFGSYTTVSDIATAEYIDKNGNKLGNTVTHQYEMGVKSDFFNHRLRFNFTYFIMNNNDYSYQVTDQTTGNVYYDQSGSLKRNGIETEVVGHVLSNLEVLLGYTHLHAKYEGVKSYVDGSEPMGTAKNLANGWINYMFNRGFLKGLSIGGGAYYVGKRPVDDYSKSTAVNVVAGGSEIQKVTPGVKPFNLSAYTTVNMQLAYTWTHYTVRVVLNNLTNSKGYNAYYPQAFLTPTDPRNFGVTFSYAF
ncbi:TonB-dependent receptor [Prevotella cerevisiae]|jgi:iron complex outermembrane receptor protein|uniref:TonB-dependent receptor n=1 Tax=Segatella cerevisiae TaxID=2053716 RepID=A0ABT1BV09_9BACT|nr:TonB-dependent receptor [Segatella cerevisiae]MCO6024530.1 TonB-dependent receptor [Segatella cerevisiae]